MLRRSFLTALCSLALAVVATTGVSQTAFAQSRTYTLAVSNYTGWIPWYYAANSGILKKWADKYNITIDVRYSTYEDSINTYIDGNADAVVISNIEALSMPAVRGVDSTVVIMGDYSNGNDAVLTRRLQLPDIKGKQVMLQKGGVSQYLLWRALQSAGLKDNDVSLVDQSDDKIAENFLADTQNKVVVTWNPMVMEIQKTLGIRKVFDSSSIPGEIQDLLIANSAAVKANPDFARALTGAWYEVMETMSTHGASYEEAVAKMADLAKVPVAEFKGQLRTTALYLTASSAAVFTKSDDLKGKTDLVRNFLSKNGLLGNVSSADAVGVEFPDGTVHGDKGNIKLRYVSTFMEEAASGRLK